MLPLWVGSPPYIAVTDVVPVLSVEVVKLVEPPLKVPVPRTVLRLMKVTVSPLEGVPELEVMTAVKVTACPDCEGFGDELSVVVVADAGVSKSNTVPQPEVPHLLALRSPP